MNTFFMCVQKHPGSKVTIQNPFWAWAPASQAAFAVLKEAPVANTLFSN